MKNSNALMMAYAMMMMSMSGGVDYPGGLRKREYHEDCDCKECGKSFTPRSHNKKVFCSTECYKTHRKQQQL